MEIVWYGQSCFRLRSRSLAVVTDPYGLDAGLKLPRLTASVITTSCDRPEHNYVQAVKGTPFVIRGPGEYEIEGIFVIGVATGEAAQNKNTAYLIEFEDLTICHLGALDRVLNQEQVEQLNAIDILLVPVGGRSTLTSGKAVDVVGLLEPKIVIPMHYKIPGLTTPLDSATRFLKELGVESVEKVDSLAVTKGQLPEETRVVLLEPKQ